MPIREANKFWLVTGPLDLIVPTIYLNSSGLSIMESGKVKNWKVFLRPPWLRINCDTVTTWYYIGLGHMCCIFMMDKL